ncbi:MAG: phosphoribosylamine--glycine ligase [Ignavibacteria bacterium]|nr:phosphoribosylamine--glycine ligase [Ignavibacteria bacterium]
MKVLLIGNGARENALAWKIVNSPSFKNSGSVLYAAPGNPGINKFANSINIASTDIQSLKNFALNEKIDFTVVGPEIPLSIGIVDEFEKEGLKIFGPSKAAAEIETSKVFSKELMQKYSVPTAKFKAFNTENLNELSSFIDEVNYPVVIKADGLAAGKGVIICNDDPDVENCIKDLTDNKIFGEAGLNFVAEQFLTGNEVSLFIITDGEDYVILPPAQDYKRIFEEDKGKNTGGMGAFTPAVKFCNDEVLKKAEEKIIKPVLSALKKEGRNYKGCLYAGLMITEEKEPFVIEFNCRFGDPETQAVLTLINSDFLELLMASSENKIKDYSLKIKNAFAGCVVLASLGYPDEFEKGKLISGLQNIDNNVHVFHAGTSEMHGKIFTNGGRVISVVSCSEKSFNSAFENIYCAIEKIDFENKYFRGDIGKIVL